MTIGSFITSLAGSCVPFVFSWVSLAHLLSLGFLGPFLNFAFPWIFTEFFGFPRPNYIIPHPWGSWACHQPPTFFTFITLDLPWPILTFPHHILPMVCFFFFSFKLICFLKANLFISWACDLLFLSLGLSEFSIHLPTLFCPRCWTSPFHLDFQNGHQHMYLHYFTTSIALGIFFKMILIKLKLYKI